MLTLIVDNYITLFWAVAEQIVKIVTPIIAIWLVMGLIRWFLRGK